MLRVEVEWIDSGLIREGLWEKKETLAETKTTSCTTTGYLVVESDDDVIIAQSYDPDHEQFANIQVIWRPAITSITVLRARESFDGSKKFDQEAE